MPMRNQEEMVKIHPQLPSPGLSSSWSSVNHKIKTTNYIHLWFGLLSFLSTLMTDSCSARIRCNNSQQVTVAEVLEGPMPYTTEKIGPMALGPACDILIKYKA